MRWLPLWILVILALSFTRDETIVALTAVAWWRGNRSRVMAWATASGVMASTRRAASVLLADKGKPRLRPQRLSDFGACELEPHPLEYPSALGTLIKLDFRYPVETAVPALAFVMGIVVVGGLAMLLVSARGARRARETRAWQPLRRGAHDPRVGELHRDEARARVRAGRRRRGRARPRVVARARQAASPLPCPAAAGEVRHFPAACAMPASVSAPAPSACASG